MLVAVKGEAIVLLADSFDMIFARPRCVAWLLKEVLKETKNVLSKTAKEGTLRYNFTWLTYLDRGRFYFTALCKLPSLASLVNRQRVYISAMATWYFADEASRRRHNRHKGFYIQLELKAY